jgi:hypothetical protein
MHVKTARADLTLLLQASQAEQLENIKTAQHNARCPVDETRPYKSAAQKALVRGVNDLIALAEQSADN